MSADLALSVKAHSSLPVSLITSPSGARLMAGKYPGLFDHFVIADRLESLEPKKRLVAAKIDAIKSSPYELAVFLDSDMVCRKDPSFLLDGLTNEDFRIFGRAYKRDNCSAVIHHGIPAIKLFEEFNLDSYVHSSLGAFGFGAAGGSRVANLMEAEEPLWRERTKKFRESLPAEILFGLIGERTGVSFYNLPGRFYQVQHMGFRWSDNVTCLHSAPMRHREAARLLSGVVSRRRRAGYPVGPSLYWVSELLNRRAEQAGRSRRQAKAVQRFNERFLAD